MKEHAWWWPVAAVATEGDTASGPQAVMLLGQPWVLWQTDSGEPMLFADKCPHRGARLSLGRVRGDTLECPYHGWRFGAQGRCHHIPSQPEFVPPASLAVPSRPLRAAHGLWWTHLGSEPALPLPDLSHLPARRLVYGPFDVATSAPRAVENFLDTSHFAFVHEGWLGDSQHPEVPAYEVSATPDGRPVIEHYRAWQPRAAVTAAQGAWVDYRYEVLSPYAALLTKRSDAEGPEGSKSPEGSEDSYVIWACPQTPESSRLWFAQYTTDTQSSDDALRDFQVEIFSQDQPVLESQQPKRLPLSGGEAMVAADRLSAAYRRYLKACGITFAVC